MTEYQQTSLMEKKYCSLNSSIFLNEQWTQKSFASSFVDLFHFEYK